MLLRVLLFFLGLLFVRAQTYAFRANCFENAWKQLGRPINSQWAIREHTKTRIKEIMHKPANRGQIWTCNNGGCIPYSVQLKRALDEAKVDLKSVKVSHQLDLRVEDGVRPGSFYHYFLEDRSWGPGGEVIVDPTIMQFFLGRPVGIDPSGIFVGTREELIQLVQQNRMLLKLPDSMSRISARSVDVEDFVDKVWGFGEAARYKFLNTL